MISAVFCYWFAYSIQLCRHEFELHTPATEDITQFVLQFVAIIVAIPTATLILHLPFRLLT